MTNEEKSILLKVLCAELQYGLLIDTPRGAFELDAISGDLISLKDKEGGLSDLCQFPDGKYWFPIVSGNYKPYLRPMKSMTEEEKDYIKKLSRLGQSDGIHYDDGVRGIPIYQETLDDQWKTDGKFPPILGDIYRFMFDYGYTILTDWLNEHHFDYRGLIEKGLALEAPDDMY